MELNLPDPSATIKPEADNLSDRTSSPPPRDPPALSPRDAVLQSSERPPIPIPYRGNIPSELQEIPCWVGWRWERRDDKWNKTPETPLFDFRADLPWWLENASSTNPATWASLDAAWENIHARTGYFAKRRDPAEVGIGFVVTVENGIVFVDLDNCRDPATGVIAEWARKIIRDLDSYTEISPSKTGVKIWLRGKKKGKNCKRTDLGIEVYDRGRYGVITSCHVEGTPREIMDRQAELDALYDQLWPAAQEEAAAQAAHTGGDDDGPAQPALPPTNLADKEIIQLLCQQPKYDALWHGSTAGYPSASEADLALTGKLAFFCGPNPDRILALLWASGLRRDKWRRHKTYLRDTVMTAIAGRTSYYRGDVPIAIDEKAQQAAFEQAMKEIERNAASRKAQANATPEEALKAAEAAQTVTGIPLFNTPHVFPFWTESWLEDERQNLEFDLTGGNPPNLGPFCFATLTISDPGNPTNKRDIQPPCRNTKRCDFCWVGYRINEFIHTGRILFSLPTVFIEEFPLTDIKKYRKRVKAQGNIRGVKGLCRIHKQPNGRAIGYSNVDTHGSIAHTPVQAVGRLRLSCAFLPRISKRRVGGSREWAPKPPPPKGYVIDLTLKDVDRSELRGFLKASKSGITKNGFLRAPVWSPLQTFYEDFDLDKRYHSNPSLAWSNLADWVQEWVWAGQPASFQADLFQPAPWTQTIFSTSGTAGPAAGTAGFAGGQIAAAAGHGGGP